MEREVSPEEVVGRVFRVPAIVGEGTGGCFNIDNLHLPRGWDRVVSQIGMDPLKVQQIFANYCSRQSLPRGEVLLNARTKVPLVVRIQTRPVSYLRLDRFLNREGGVYKMEDVQDARVAIALQAMATRLLSPFWVGTAMYKYGPPCVDGAYGVSYHSRDLRIPDCVYNQEGVQTNEYYRYSFLLRANNIAGRFGVSVSHSQIAFDERGFLSHVAVVPGSACSYTLDASGTPDCQAYTGHNVDSPRQVLALHGIVAEHINDLLRRQDHEYY